MPRSGDRVVKLSRWQRFCELFVQRVGEGEATCSIIVGPYGEFVLWAGRVDDVPVISPGLTVVNLTDGERNPAPVAS